MAPSTVNVAALHLLKKREAKSSAEFFKLEDTRRIGESGQDVAAIGCGGMDCSTAIALLVTVLSPLNRAVRTDVAKDGVAATAAPAATEVTGVAEPGAKRRGAFDRLDMLNARWVLLNACLRTFQSLPDYGTHFARFG